MESDIIGFGEERSEMNYSGLGDWLASFRDPYDLWKTHPSFFICEFSILFGTVIILVHALKTGGRWPWLFFASMTHGFVVEFISYFSPYIDNFWHGQSILTLFDRRMPLYITIIYAVFYYHATWVVSKLKLKSDLVEHMAVGLIIVLIDIPFDIVGVKYLHWIWHDTDPNIYDRHYWVPWTSYYFHLSFGCSFMYWFHSVRKWVEKRKNLEKWEAGSLKSEIISLIVASLLGMPGGCLLFLPVYHPLHDFYDVPSEITFLIIMLVFTVTVWKFDRKSNRYQKPDKMNLISKILFGHLMVHYLVNLGTAIFFNPENIVSVGLHQKIGNCNETEPVDTLLKTLQRNKYLCVDDYDEPYYDFHCLPDGKPPSDGSVWYTICGTPFENRAEYITILSLITFVAYVIFITIHFDYDENVESLWKKVELRKKVK